jgi:hypothetical protein
MWCFIFRRIKYSPCYSNDSNPLSPAIEEVQMNNSRVEQNQPIQQYQQIPNDQKIQPPRPTPQSKTVRNQSFEFYFVAGVSLSRICFNFIKNAK